MQGTLGCWEDRGTAKLQAPAGRPPLRPILVRRVLCGLHGVVLGPVLRWLLFSLGTGCRERTHSANGGAGHAGGRRGLAGMVVAAFTRAGAGGGAAGPVLAGPAPGPADAADAPRGAQGGGTRAVMARGGGGLAGRVAGGRAGGWLAAARFPPRPGRERARRRAPPPRGGERRRGGGGGSRGRL